MKINYFKKILIIAVLTFVVVLILDFVFTNILLGKIISINDKVRQLDISSQERERELSQKDSVASTEAERAKLAGYFVNSGNTATVDFTKYLENLALQSNVTQSKSLNYEPVTGMASSDILSVIRYRFLVTGKYENVYSFVRAVENLPKISYINSLSMNYDSSNKSWSADIDFSVVKFK